MNSVLTVNLNDRHTVLSARQIAMAHFKHHGIALWLRYNGSATLFYTDETGKKRQKTWEKTSLKYIA